MPSTRSSAHLPDQQSSPPAASQENNKRKADDSQASPSKKGRKDTAEQKTIEETMKLTDNHHADSHSKPSDTNGAPAEQKPSEQASEAEKKPAEDNNDTHMKDDNSIQQVGESYQGNNREGEAKDDPEKALKDSRGGQGLNTIEPDKPKPKPENLPIVSSFMLSTKTMPDKLRTTFMQILLPIPMSRQRIPTSQMARSSRAKIVLRRCPATYWRKASSTFSLAAVLASKNPRAFKTSSAATLSFVPCHMALN
jgi:hypothetical protein